MATLPTNFSVTKTRSCPIPNPEPGVPSPGLINPQDFIGPPKPFIIDPVSGATIPNPVLFGSLTPAAVESPGLINAELRPNVETPDLIGPESQPNIDTPDLIGSEAQPNVETPDLITSQNQPDIETPDLLTAQQKADVETPDLIGSETQPDLPTPDVITPVAGTATTPPFPRNHARFQYDNKLFGYSAITATTGTNPEFSVIPNTGQRWQFDNTAEIEIDLPSSTPMDTVCIGAHNLSGQNFTVDVEYDPSGGGTFTPFGSTVTPTTNNAIMIHLNGEVPVTTLKVIITGTGVSKFIGYISGGVALQMQRPFFNGHTPVTDERFTEFYTSWTETYNIIGRDVRRRGQENTPSWTNLSDTWYRTYLEPVKDTLELFPFFFAWNLEEYPDDVGLMILTNWFSAPMQNGTMIRRDVSMQMRGAL